MDNPRGERCKNCGKRDKSVRARNHHGVPILWCDECTPDSDRETDEQREAWQELAHKEHGGPAPKKAKAKMKAKAKR